MTMRPTDTSSAEPGTDLSRLLDAASPRKAMRRKLRFAALGVVALGLIAGLLVLRSQGQATGPTFKTEPATIGTLVVKVSATGNLKPTNLVEVGSELSGIVTEVLVDDNDRVTKAQVLARLDLSRLRDAVAKSRAALEAAEAQVIQAQATVMEARAALARFRQVAELSGGRVPSKSELDTAEASMKRAEASEAGARASVSQARANLQSDETNLAKASIRSPIDGVVLTRKVEPGQTVAAALQSPVLFTLAEDLSKMELQVDVDEADVGHVAVGQRATFTVDAWPGRRYSGIITRVGFGSTTKDGVVSYPTVLSVENGDLSLRPGMTGTADIVTITRENALLVPNAALRFSPSTEVTTPTAPKRSLVGRLMPRPPALPRKDRTSPNNNRPRVWVLENGVPVAVDVETGASNGQITEIVGGSIEAGTMLITEAVGEKS